MLIDQSHVIQIEPFERVQRPLPQTQLDQINALNLVQVRQTIAEFPVWLQGVRSELEGLDPKKHSKVKIRFLKQKIDTSDARWEALQARARQLTFLAPPQGLLGRIVSMMIAQRIFHM